MLEELYREFESHDCISYFPEYDLPEENDDGEEVNPEKYPGLRLSFKKVEALLIQRKDGGAEHVLIAALPGQSELLIRWAGLSANSMKKTVECLSLPSHSENLGETVFHIFAGHLADIRDNEPVCFTQKVVAGKEKQLQLLIAKVIWVYEGRRVRGEFYERWRNRRTNRCTGR